MNKDEKEQLAQAEYDYFTSAAPIDTFDDRPFTQDDEWQREEQAQPSTGETYPWEIGTEVYPDGKLIYVEFRGDNPEVDDLWIQWLTPDQAVQLANHLLFEVEAGQSAWDGRAVTWRPTHYSIHDGSTLQVIGRIHRRDLTRVVVRNECDDTWVDDAANWAPLHPFDLDEYLAGFDKVKEIPR